MIWLLIVAAVVVGLGIVLHNKMVGLRRLTENAWSDVDVYLKKRAELVPNLVEAVKGAATYERATFESIANARSDALAARGPTAERAAAESTLASGVARVVGIAEAYPQLRASENFLALQADLSETERHIASARQYYNACVRDFNTLIESFPANLLASPMGLRPKEFFEIEASAERVVPAVRGLE